MEAVLLDLLSVNIFTPVMQTDLQSILQVKEVAVRASLRLGILFLHQVYNLRDGDDTLLMCSEDSDSIYTSYHGNHVKLATATGTRKRQTNDAQL